MLSYIRRRLTWKLFFSYLVVVLVGAVVLATTAELVIPNAFERHMVGMMGEGGMGMMMDRQMEDDLFTSFRAAVSEALTRATLAAVIAAVAVSLFVSRQVVAPIQAMREASQHIADGHYEERVHIPGDPSEADELGQLALSFNRMAAKLAQTENMRRQLIGDVAHELRTPLTTIKGSMEGLMDGVLPPTPEVFQEIYREADRLQRLVADLQELSRVEARAYELNPAPARLGELIARVAARLEPQFASKGVALETSIPPDLPPALIDEDRITQVLTNLIGNALQYTPSGGKVHIQCSLIDKPLPAHITPQGEVRADRWILVSVRDTGIGIPPEHLPHIFDRFYRVDKSRSRVSGGSGIGLTIAKHLVEAHGGYIWAESEGAGKGSTFSFVLPALLR